MDKNKSRTDMLAAGRKKLQQYRKKKDGRGSKTSGKAGTPEQAVDDDTTAAEVKPIVAKGVHEVGLSSSDGVEQDVDSSLQNETGHSSVGDNTAASGSSLEKWEMVECEGKSPQVGEPKSVDLSGPPDFGAVIEVASEVVMRAHRPDQEAEYSGSKQTHKSSMIQEDGDLAISGTDERAEADVSAAAEDVDVDATLLKADQSHKPYNVSVLEGETIGLQEVQKADWPSDSPRSKPHYASAPVGSSSEVKEPWKAYDNVDSSKSLLLPDGDLAGSSEHLREAVGLIEEKSEALMTSGDSANGSLGAVQEFKLDNLDDSKGPCVPETNSFASSLASKMIPGVDGGLISLSQLAGVVQGLAEDEFRFLILARESATKSACGLSMFTVSDALETLMEQLYVSNVAKDMFQLQLTETLEIQAEFGSQHRRAGEAQAVFSMIPDMVQENIRHDDSSRIPDNGETLHLSPVLESSLFIGPARSLPLNRLTLDLYDDSFGFVPLREHLKQADIVFQKLEKAIEEMHSHSASLNRSSTKVVAPAVSKLIQAFESKAHADDSDGEGVPLPENHSLADTYLLVKEQTVKLSSLLQELNVDADNASELFKGERNGKILSESTVRELKIQRDALQEQNYSLEEAKVELVVLYELIAQHVCDVEAKKNEILLLYEALRQQDFIATAENSELRNKLSACKSRISNMQVQLDELYQNANEMISSISSRTEVLQNDVSDRAFKLDKEWNSTISWLANEVEKLDANIGSAHACQRTGTEDNQDIGTRVAASFEAASRAIHDLQEKLDAAHADHESLRGSCDELNEKLNDMHGQNKVVTGLLHQICAGIGELVNDSSGFSEGSEPDIPSWKLLDPLHTGATDALMEQLRRLLDERLLLKSINSQLNSDLICKMNNIEEMKRKCLSGDAMSKLVQHVQGVVNLEDLEINVDEPASFVESLTYFLLQRYKEVNDKAILSREELGCRENKLNELHAQVDHYILMLVNSENEDIVFKESLKSTVEDLEAVQSYILAKATELEQSEQRVSSLREKLSIAVAKGKGLIVQRDSLKQSLAEKFGELERCLQELQLKDARILEMETKLKPYSEAGERVEALESELSYIRNSATALRESFLLKDSVLQRIEEILEDLELPEQFHARDIIEKIDWLARSVTGNLMPPPDWDHKSSVGAGSYTDAWKEDLPQHTNTEDELKRKYEDLQGKFYGLAEQNEMLEQSLMERNNLVQRWEEILDKINMPSQLRSMEPEDRIEWLGGALSEAVHRCDSLQQKIENFENFCGALSADLEESHRRISDLQGALQSITREKEHLSSRLEILTRDNDNVSAKADLFEVQNFKLQNEVTELQEKLELMRGLEDRIHQITSEKERISANLEILTHDNHEVTQKADLFEIQCDKLKNEVTSLQEKLDLMCGLEESIHQLKDDIRRLQDLLSDVLQDSDEVEHDSGTTGIERLEQLIHKLVLKYSSLSAGVVTEATVDERITERESEILGDETVADSVDAKGHELAVLEEELEECRESLRLVKEERDGYEEKNQFLVHEVEKLDIKRTELQELLNQEELKSASVKEKLNLAVRKGKSLVQQRDSMRQTIDELTTEVERLKAELNVQEIALSESEKKVKDLSVYQDMIEVVKSESLIVQNRLIEIESDLQDKSHTLSVICDALGEIDIGVEYNVMDPAEKIVRLSKLWHGLRAAAASSEQESNKSRRAAELLLAELNEVQERNDGFQEELAKAATELSELAKEKDMEEAAKNNALSHVDHLKSVLSEERNNQVVAFTTLNSYADQLRKEFFNLNNLLSIALSKDMEVVHNFGASLKSFLRSADVADIINSGFESVPAGIASTTSEKEAEFLSVNSFSESQDKSNNSLSEICNSVGRCIQEITTEIGALKGKLYTHSSALHEEANSLTENLGIIFTEMSSHKQSFESMKRDITRLESIEKEKDGEIMLLHRNISLLYEACKCSVMEFKKWKAQLVDKGFNLRDYGFNSESVTSISDDNVITGQTDSYSEALVSTMAAGLLSAVKEIVNVQNEVGEISQLELKTTISNLQRQLQEKDIEKDKICLELVNQIKEAESKAIRYLQELQSAKDQMVDLDRRKVLMEEERSRLQLKVDELQNSENSSIELRESLRSMTDVIAAKETEIEDLMQALDAEESQMEDLKNKIYELEIVLQKKSADLENAEASRGKLSKKLSVTVRKFDELHHLSESLLTEIEKLQSQLHDRDSEISFLRQEVTRCTNDALVATQMSKEKKSDEIHDFMSWLDSIIGQVQMHEVLSDDEQTNQDHQYKKEILQKQIMSILSELEDLRAGIQGRDNMLRLERSRIEELMRKGEFLEKDLEEKESQLTILQRMENSGQTSTTSEIMEIEPVTNKWAVPGPSVTPQVRSLRKSNNEQVAISVDMDPGSGRELEDEDDDKAHGFKSLTTSKVIPRFTRPVTDLIDGLWVSCDRALMRQPALRLSVIMYWFMLHALLAIFAV